MTAKTKTQKQKPPRKIPTKYDQTLPKRAYQLVAESGLTDKQLARAFGIGRRTLWRWRQRYPELNEAVLDGRDAYMTGRAELSLARRAEGLTVRETTEKYDKENRLIGRTVKIKEIPPDTTAIIFQLKNRAPGRWRDVWHHSHGGNIQLVHHMGDVDPPPVDVTPSSGGDNRGGNADDGAAGQVGRDGVDPVAPVGLLDSAADVAASASGARDAASGEPAAGR